MYTNSDLTREIAEVIGGLVNCGSNRLHPDWITQSIINNHPDIKGVDSDFFICTGRNDVRGQVRKALNKFKEKPDRIVDKQIVLPGFERLQKYYLIGEDDDQVAVRVQDMTPDQLQSKIDAYRAMGDGCHQHADELVRYLEQRHAA